MYPTTIVLQCDALIIVKLKRLRVEYYFPPPSSLNSQYPISAADDEDRLLLFDTYDATTCAILLSITLKEGIVRFYSVYVRRRYGRLRICNILD